MDRDSYGIIHSDMHNGNLFVHDGKITVLDFDDCHYNWFAFDIAIPLFYVMRNVNVSPDDTEYARHFMSCFMDGYMRENRVDSYWMKLIPEFMKLREMDLYIIIIRDDIADLNGWCRRFMENRRFRIENEIPVLDLDFAEFV
jgi:Ser/Thr protein kinase RdoA (MazF antagonist)